MNTAQFLSEMDTLVRELKENTLNKDYAVTKTDRTLAEITNDILHLATTKHKKLYTKKNYTKKNYTVTLSEVVRYKVKVTTTDVDRADLIAMAKREIQDLGMCQVLSVNYPEGSAEVTEEKD